LHRCVQLPVNRCVKLPVKLHVITAAAVVRTLPNP